MLYTCTMLGAVVTYTDLAATSNHKALQLWYASIRWCLSVTLHRSKTSRQAIKPAAKHLSLSLLLTVPCPAIAFHVLFIFRTLYVCGQNWAPRTPSS